MNADEAKNEGGIRRYSCDRSFSSCARRASEKIGGGGTKKNSIEWNGMPFDPGL